MIEILNVSRGDYYITTDRNSVDLKVVHDYLCNQSYWTQGVPLERVKTAADHSLNFSLFHHQDQIGYARVITDYCQIAYLGDVFILEAHRGKGLGKWLIANVHQHPNLQDLRNWLLGTRDAHGLYRQFGWDSLAEPHRWMARPNPMVYRRKATEVRKKK